MGLMNCVSSKYSGPKVCKIRRLPVQKHDTTSEYNRYHFFSVSSNERVSGCVAETLNIFIEDKMLPGAGAPNTSPLINDAEQSSYQNDGGSLPNTPLISFILGMEL